MFGKLLAMIGTFAVGYLVGSVNLSILVTKYIGKFDIHTKGSGNAGGTNVIRTMGAVSYTHLPAGAEITTFFAPASI